MSEVLPQFLKNDEKIPKTSVDLSLQADPVADILRGKEYRIGQNYEFVKGQTASVSFEGNTFQVVFEETVEGSCTMSDYEYAVFSVKKPYLVTRDRFGRMTIPPKAPFTISKSS